MSDISRGRGGQEGAGRAAAVALPAGKLALTDDEAGPLDRGETCALDWDLSNPTARRRSRAASLQPRDGPRRENRDRGREDRLRLDVAALAGIRRHAGASSTCAVAWNDASRRLLPEVEAGFVQSAVPGGNSSIGRCGFVQIAVAIVPGSMIETWIPNGASSTRSESAIASSANFDIAYAPRNGSAERPPTEPIRTTRPRDRRSAGKNACSTRSCPTTFTSSWRVNSSGGKNSSGAAIPMPALSTSASSWSSTPAAWPIAAGSVTSKTSSVVPSGASRLRRTEA